MSVQEEINHIIQSRYNNYEPELFQRIGVLHSAIREMVGDENFLDFLKKCERENPQPVYTVPEEIMETIKSDIKEKLDLLTDEERHSIIGSYCTHCGSKNPYCQCWNDE